MHRFICRPPFSKPDSAANLQQSWRAFVPLTLQSWRKLFAGAFRNLGVANINAPGMYHTSTGLDPGTTIGGYRGVTTPEEPIIVRMVRNPNKPGLPRREQHRAGQQELLSMAFEQF